MARKVPVYKVEDLTPGQHEIEGPGSYHSSISIVVLEIACRHLSLLMVMEITVEDPPTKKRPHR
jgi:hypothetical protein